MYELATLANKLKEKGVLVLYSGVISQEVIETVGARIRAEADDPQGGVKTVHTLFTIFVELAQNVMHHGVSSAGMARDGADGHYGTLVIGRENGAYYVVSTSVVKADRKSSLQEKLKMINSATDEELDEYYRDQKKRGRYIPGDRAGIGLIWIARKSNKPLEYQFKEYENDELLFTLKVCL